MPAKKTTQNGTFNGNLNFDFRDSSSETVEASEDFDQAYLNIKLKGASKLSDSSEKLKLMIEKCHIQTQKNMDHILKRKILRFQRLVKPKDVHLSLKLKQSVLMT